jgi:hypothetical protein
MTQVYKTAAAFKQGLEQRLRTSSGSGLALARRRQLVVFQRFLARVALEFGDAVTLKGGLAVEMRIERARTTKDVDLRMMGSPDDMLGKLRAAAQREVNDYMLFVVRPDDRHPTIQNDAMAYDGMRFRAECTLAGKIYGGAFGVDVAFGEPIFGEPDTILTEDTLGFAGIAPPILRVYPVETHIAEKLHAYTMPRVRPNSRVKDLPDLGLIASAGAVDAGQLRAAIDQTFTFRRTHDVPARLPAPASAWEQPYATMAKADALPWATLSEAFAAASAFMDPVLAGTRDAVWNPRAGLWAPSTPGPGAEEA